MKQLFLSPVQFILFLFIIIPVSAATYYLRSDGNDGAAGTSDIAAWKTIGHAASTAQTGDVIQLRRGDVFREKISTLPGGVTLRDYGSGALPAVSGSVAITGWTRQGSTSIYTAHTDSAIQYLFVNNRLQRLARFPNRGWLKAASGRSGTGTTTILVGGADLTTHSPNTVNYWNNANVRWRRWSWWFETRQVTGYAANGELTLTGAFQPQGWEPTTIAGWGYYIDNVLGELDTAGEWFINRSTGTVSLWAPGGVDPTGLLVEGSMRNSGLTLGSSWNGTAALIENIAFRQQTDVGLQINGTTTVRGCRFENIGSDSGGAGLSGGWSTRNALVTGCVFENCFNNGISWNQNPATVDSTRIVADTFTNIGAVPGYGGAGSWHCVGIVIPNGKNMVVRQCVFDTIGYAGIIFGSDGCCAEYNIIRTAMSTLNDGGGIYSNCSYNTFRRNIILYTEGDLESSGPWANLGHAIWPEFLSDFHHNTITDNTLAWSGGFGIFLPNNFTSTITGNVCYGNQRAQIELEGELTNSSTGRTQNLPQNHVITGNTFFSTADSQHTLLYRPEYDYGTIDANAYAKPRSDSLIGQWQTNGGWSISSHSLSWWRTNYTKADAHPKTTAIKRPANPAAGDQTGTSKLVYNDQMAQRQVPIGDNGIYVDLDGVEHSGVVDLAPFKSVVLVHTGRTSAVKNFGARQSLAGRITVINSQSFLSVKMTLKKVLPVRIALYSLDGRKISAFEVIPTKAGALRIDIPQTGIADKLVICEVRIGGELVERLRLTLTKHF